MQLVLTVAPIINMFAIYYSFKKILLTKNKTTIISILPNIIKNIKDNLVKLLKAEKLKLSIPYRPEVTVFVNVNIDNLKAFSKVRFSKANMLDKTNMPIKKVINTRKAILASSSSIIEYINWFN